MHAAQWTDLSNTTLEGKTYLCLNCQLIIAIGAIIISTPPKAAETTEILTDIGHMEVLVFHIRYNVACFALPNLICNRYNFENIPVPYFQKPGCLDLSKTMSPEYI